MVSWLQAVKQYAQDSGKKFTIPKKDSDEYKAIKALQTKMTESEVKGLVKEKKEKKTKVVVKEEEKVVESVVEKPLVKIRTVKPITPPVEEPPKQQIKPKKRVPKVKDVPKEPVEETPVQPEPEPLIKKRKTKKELKEEKVISQTPLVEEVKPEPEPVVKTKVSRREIIQKKKEQKEKPQRLAPKKTPELRFIDQQVTFSFD